MVHRLARCGGDNPGSVKAATGLVKIVEQDCGFGELLTTVEDGEFLNKVVLPSTTLKLVSKLFPEKFARLLGADPASLGEFWGNMRARPSFAAYVAANPTLRALSPSDWQFLAPLTIHEDAGPFSRRLSTVVISFSGFLGRGNEKVTQCIIGSNVKESDIDQGDIEQAWQPILEDFRRLSTEGACGFRYWLLFSKASSGTRPQLQKSLGKGVRYIFLTRSPRHKVQKRAYM